MIDVKVFSPPLSSKVDGFKLDFNLSATIVFFKFQDF